LVTMDAIRKKMQSLKTEADTMTAAADRFEKEAEISNKKADKHDADIRDLQKKISQLESKYDDTFEKLQASTTKEEEKDKEWKSAEEDVNNLARRLLLVEEEVRRRDTDLASTVMELCHTSRSADVIARKVKVLQSKNMTNEVLLEELIKDVKEAEYHRDEGDRKYVEISRRLGVLENELKRAVERANLAEDKNVSLEEELRNVGENMIQLEVSEEKALEREERYKEQIRSLVLRLKEADKRAEYGEMNITKLHLRIDDLEDEIVREKLKIKKLSDELGDTFEEMMTKY